MLGLFNKKKYLCDLHQKQRQTIIQLKRENDELRLMVANNMRKTESLLSGISIENAFVLNTPKSINEFAKSIDGWCIGDKLSVSIIIDQNKKEMFKELRFLCIVGEACQKSGNNYNKGDYINDSNR